MATENISLGRIAEMAAESFTMLLPFSLYQNKKRPRTFLGPTMPLKHTRLRMSRRIIREQNVDTGGPSVCILSPAAGLLAELDRLRRQDGTATAR